MNLKDHTWLLKSAEREILTASGSNESNVNSDERQEPRRRDEGPIFWAALPTQLLEVGAAYVQKLTGDGFLPFLGLGSGIGVRHFLLRFWLLSDVSGEKKTRDLEAILFFPVGQLAFTFPAIGTLLERSVKWARQTKIARRKKSL